MTSPLRAGANVVGRRAIVHVALLVADYDEAIAFYVDTPGFELLEDTYIPEQDKR